MEKVLIFSDDIKHSLIANKFEERVNEYLERGWSIKDIKMTQPQMLRDTTALMLQTIIFILEK